METTFEVIPEVLVYCRECNAPIGPLFLPQPYGDGKPKAIIVGGVPVHVACPGCGHVYSYRTSDMYFREEGMPEIRPMPKNRISVRTRRNCGADGCERLLVIHTTMIAGTPTSDLILAPLNWTFHIRCNEGHELRSAPLTTYDIEGVNTPQAQVN
jgi:hypothetical protein